MAHTRYFEIRNEGKVRIIDDSYKNFALKDILLINNYKVEAKWGLWEYDTTKLNTLFTGVCHVMLNVFPFNDENLLAISCDVSDICYATYIHDDILTIYAIRGYEASDPNVSDATYIAEHTRILHYVPSERVSSVKNLGLQIFNRKKECIFDSSKNYLRVIDSITQDIYDLSDVNKIYSWPIAVIPFSCRYTASYHPQMVNYFRFYFSFSRLNDKTQLRMLERLDKSVPPYDYNVLTGHFYNTNLLIIKG